MIFEDFRADDDVVEIALDEGRKQVTENKVHRSLVNIGQPERHHEEVE